MACGDIRASSRHAIKSYRGRAWDRGGTLSQLYLFIKTDGGLFMFGLCFLDWNISEKPPGTFYRRCYCFCLLACWNIDIRYWENCSRHFNAELGIEVSVRVLL